MGNALIPVAYIIPVLAALVAAISVLWYKIDSVQKSERSDCDKKISALDSRLRRVEEQRNDYEERWRREVQRGAEMAARPRRPDEPPPAELPAPDWEESTEVRILRARIEKATLDEKLARYLESTPPRARMPSRPR